MKVGTTYKYISPSEHTTRWTVLYCDDKGALMQGSEQRCWWYNNEIEEYLEEYVAPTVLTNPKYYYNVNGTRYVYEVLYESPGGNTIFNVLELDMEVCMNKAQIASHLAPLSEDPADKTAIYKELLDAAKITRSIVSEGAMTGFNYKDGDWAERLFQNQGNLSTAIKKMEFILDKITND